MPIFLWSTVVSQSITQDPRYVPLRGSIVVVAIVVFASAPSLGDRHVPRHVGVDFADEPELPGGQRRDLVGDAAGLGEDLPREQRIAPIVDGDVVRLVLLVLERDAEGSVGRDLERVDVELQVVGRDLDRDLALAAVGGGWRRSAGERRTVLVEGV